MFKKFGKEEISGYTQVKASVARGIRCKGLSYAVHMLLRLPGRQLTRSFHCAAASVGEQYPFLSESGILDALIPKKEPLYVAKT